MHRQVELLEKSHDVLLLGRRNDELRAGISAVAKATVSLGERRAILGVIEDFRPDVIHVHNIYPSLGPAVHQVARRLDIPLVMTVHNFRLRCPNGVMFTEGRRCDRCVSGRYYNAVLHDCFPSKAQASGYAAFLWIHRFVSRLDDAISVFVTPSEFLRKTLVSWDFEPSRVRLVRHATRDMVPAAPDNHGSWGAYLGRLAPEKGLGDLLRALRKAGDPPFRVAGDGPLREELEATARDLRLRNTEFVGHLAPDEIEGFLHGVRFLALPSVCEENSPLAACEAMSVGRAIIVTDRGGLPELASEGRGIIFRVGDVDALARGIRALTDDDSLCMSYGRQAFEFALRELSAEAHERRLTSIYLGIASGRRKVH